MARSAKPLSWRLVHDGKDVLFLDETSGYTETKFQLFEARTKGECMKEIQRLGLHYVEGSDDLKG